MSNGSVPAPHASEADSAKSQRTILGGLLARFTADRDMLITSVHACELEIKALAARLEEPPSAVSTADSVMIRELRESFTHLRRAQSQAIAEARTIAEQAMARVEEMRRRLEALASHSARDGNGELADDAPDHDALRPAVDECMHRIEALAARLDARHASLEPALHVSRQRDGTTTARRELSDRAAERLASIEAELKELRHRADQAREPQIAFVPPKRRRSPALMVSTGVVAVIVLAVASLVLRPSSPHSTAGSARTARHVEHAPSQVSGAAPQLADPKLEAAAPADRPPEPLPPAAGPGAVADAPAAAALAAANPGNLDVPDATAPPAASAPVAADAPTAPRLPEFIALGPEGATVCVIEPQQRRACIYRHASDAVVSDGCYPIAAAPTLAWPRWLAASDTNAERIRLVDESGQKRLKIVSASGGLRPDAAQVAQSDFEALANRTTPWRTAWLVFDAAATTPPPPDTAGLRATLEDWRHAWEQARVDDYLSLYSASFVPESEPSVAQWRARRRSVFERSGSISVQIHGSVISVYPDGKAFVSFEQSYRSALSTSVAFKVMQWQREGDLWKVRRETVLHESKG